MYQHIPFNNLSGINFAGPAPLVSITCWFQGRLCTSRDTVSQLEASSDGCPWAQYCLQLELHIKICEISHWWKTNLMQGRAADCPGKAKSTGLMDLGGGGSPGRALGALLPSAFDATLSEQHPISSKELLLLRVTGCQGCRRTNGTGFPKQ